MRDHSNHITLSRKQATDELLARSNFTPATETVSVRSSFGRVLAQDVTSITQAPNTLTCCMDSIAVRWEDFEGLGEGQLPDTSQWVRGVNWEFANTGVAMPDGFDTAIVIEHVTVSPDEQHVEISAAPSARYAGTRPAGSSLDVGDMLACAGTLVTPDVAARIASGNVTAVPVRVRPKVAFIPTGDELVAPGAAKVPAGRNLETNSIVVEGKVKAWGGEYLPFDIVPDDPEAIGRAVLAACDMADIVILNAGSSKGSGDWACEELEKLGEIICHETNHGPGHHSNFAIVNGKPIVGISGPSGGASFTLNFYLRPLIMQFLGLSPEPETVPVVLDAPFESGFGKPKHKAASNECTAARPEGKKIAGEERPSVVAPGEEFFGVKFLKVEAGADGMLHATPLPGKAGSPQTLSGNAYYLLPAGANAKQPQVGDVIEIEWR